MCGFSGWILTKEINTKLMVSSLHCIKHRGPDDTLITIDSPPKSYSCNLSNETTQNLYPSLPNNIFTKLCFGFNRLSIVDLSNNAMQPYYDDKEQILFMMNGEVYNFNELRNKYLKNVNLTSKSDSEIAFQLYKIFGDSFVDKLSGMYSIVIFNYRTLTLSAWRDRFGIKPFYYTVTEEGIYFSSEIKSLFSMQVKKEINYTGLSYSMYLGTCPSPLTIYKEIYSLQPGHLLNFNIKTSKISINHYWKLQFIPNKQIISKSEFISDLDGICKLHATGDVEKAIMLSGGLDSGSLAYFFGKQHTSIEAVHIYSKHIDSEYDFAQINAQNAGIKINNIEIDSKLTQKEIEYYLNSEEEPNVCPEPALYLCKKIKDMKFKVLYNALGPDEIFGGYEYYQKANKLSKFIFFLNLPMAFYPSKYRHKISEIQSFGLQAFPFISRQLFKWKEINQFLLKENQEIPEHPISFINKQITNIYPSFNQLPLLKKMSYYDIFYYISSHHTFRSDEPSMRYSIEMRFPFLEHTYVEKYFNQEDTFDNINKNLKPKFRDNLKNILASKTFKMGKRGFTIPIEKIQTEIPYTNKNWYLKMLEYIRFHK